jgi:hypothetical protein
VARYDESSTNASWFCAKKDRFSRVFLQTRYSDKIVPVSNPARDAPGGLGCLIMLLSGASIPFLLLGIAEGSTPLSSCQEVCKESSGGSNPRRLRCPFSILESNVQVNLSHELRSVEPSEVLLGYEK